MFALVEVSVLVDMIIVFMVKMCFKGKDVPPLL